MRIKRCLAVYLVPLGMVLVTGLAVGASIDHLRHDRVYTVAEVEAQLERDPAAWLHRPLRVRATLGGQCTAMGGLYTQYCTSWRLALTDPRFPDGQSADGSIQPLPLAWDRPPAWLTFLRRLPLVGQLVAPPQLLHSGVAATYRIELRPTACVLWQDIACDEALLIDALPPDNSTDWVRIGS